MRSLRLDLAAVSAALVGLGVSAAVAWPGLASDTPFRAAPEPPAAVAPVASRPPVDQQSTRGSPDRHQSRHQDREKSQHPAQGSQRSQPPPRSVATGPMFIDIGAIGFTSPVRPVGVGEGGEMSLPDNPEKLGWYRYGSAPAERGSTVVAGHLDSVEYGVGPLVRLRTAVVGDRVAVTTRDGATTTYVVSSIDRYNRSALPPEIFAREGPRMLRLITCGGEYDADEGGYQLNLVVTAVPV